MSDAYLTVREVVKRLKCHRLTVYRMIWNGRLPAAKVGVKYGFEWRILESDLNSYMKAARARQYRKVRQKLRIDE